MKKSEELYQEFCKNINTKQKNLKKIDSTRITLKNYLEDDDLNLKTLKKLENDPNLRVGLIKSYDCKAFILNNSTPEDEGDKITNKEITDYLKKCESPELAYGCDPLWERISSKWAECSDFTNLIGEDLKKEDIPNLFLDWVDFEHLTDITESFIEIIKSFDHSDIIDNKEHQFVCDYFDEGAGEERLDHGDVIGINFSDNEILSMITTDSELYLDDDDFFKHLQFFTIQQ